MAMTITKAPDGDISVGNLRGVIVNCSTPGSDYTVGGYSVVAANIGLWKILSVVFPTVPGGYDLSWNTSTQKMQWYATGAAAAGSAEVTANNNTTGPYAFQVTFVGL